MSSPQTSTHGRVEVLIAKDNLIQAEQLKHALERRGHSVTVAGNGKEAIEAAFARKPTLIVSDIETAEMDGYALCKRLKTRKELEHVPVLLMTSFSGPEDVVKVLECGAELGEKQMELTRLTAALEKQVAERTAELRSEIAEHKLAAEQLRQGEEQFRIITESISDLIAVLDLEGKRLYNSPSYKDVLGDPIALRGTDSFNEIHPDDREKIRKIFQETVRTGRGQRAEYRFLLSDGSIRQIESQGSVIRDADGKTAKVVVVSRDITERKWVEEALRQSESELREALLAAQMGVWEWTVATDTVTWDENLYRIAGRDPKLPAPRYQEHPQVYTPESWDRLKTAVENALATGTPYELDLDLIRPDGSKRWLVGRGEAPRDASGRITQLRGTVQDITERKRAEEALRESEEKYRSLVSNIPDVSWTLDDKRRFVFISSNIERVSGFSPDEVYQDGARLYLSSLHPDDISKVKEAFRALFAEGRPFDVEVRARRKDGEWRWVHHRALATYEKNGIRYADGLLSDITERKRGEEALRQSEATLKEALLAAQMGVWEWTLSNNTITWDDNLYRIAGRDPKLPTPCYREHRKIFAQESWDRLKAAVENALATGTPYEIDLDLIRPDGSKRWLIGRGEPLRDASGRITQLRGTVQDITERKRTEEALRESEERYRQLFEAESDAILVVEVDTGRILDANPAALMLYGYSREEFLFLTAGEVFAEPGQTQEAISSERAQVQLRWHRKKDGTVFPVELTGNSFVNQGRKIHVAAVRDIAERLRAEIEHTRLVTAIEQSVEAVVITNTKGDIEYVNPAFTRITGYSREEVLGQNPRILKSTKQDPVFYRQLWRTIINGQTWHGELINQRKDGSLYTEEMNIAPVRGARGEVTHFIATKQDVTERKTLEEQVRQAAKMEAVGRLAGGIAHDFNNLLTIINGYSQLVLHRLGADDPMRDPIDEIMKAGDRAASLTRQLLAFSRQQVLAPRVLDLNDVVANVGQMLHRLIGEDINLVMVLGPGLGRVKADAGQIEQILMNLCVNARDAMPEGGKLVIETANVEWDEAYAHSHTAVDPGRYVMLAVSDTGIGMSAEIQAHIFEPFFTTKVKDKGTGLGLATVYGIVKQSGGYIWVYSEPARGSTFKIFLPRVKESGTPAQFSETPGPPVAASETILLVEDEKALRALAARILQGLGYKVLESTSPEDALQISEKHTEPIDLLLTDVVLPRMSGRKVAELLAPLRPDMKVLYMSGYTDDAIVRSGVLEATAAFLQKPFTPAILARKVREVLDAGGENGS